MKSNLKTIGRSVFRWALAILSAYCCSCAVLPFLTMGILNYGTWALLIVFVPTLFFTLCPSLFFRLLRKLRRTRIGRITVRAATILLCTIALYSIVMTASMGLACAKHPPEDPDVPLVVLGCQVYPHGPSPVLLQRLNKALTYLQEHPNTVCVVSGGQGSNEAASEASVMADWLIRQGIDPARILLEDRSRNTEENIRFSAQLLQDCGINARRMIITTDWWHQLRARVWVERQNYTYYSLPCATYPPLQILFLARELCGIVRLLLLGY